MSMWVSCAGGNIFFPHFSSNASLRLYIKPFNIGALEQLKESALESRIS